MNNPFLTLRNGVPSYSNGIIEFYDYIIPILVECAKKTTSKRLRIAEIGVFYGAAVIHACQILKSHRIDFEVYAIDTFQGSGETHRKLIEKYGDMEIEFTKNIDSAGFKHNVNAVRMISHEAAELVADNFFDLVFIDADHRYSAVLKDLESWYPKTKHVFSGHDFSNPKHSRVKEALQTFFEKDFEKIQVLNDCWFLKR